MLIFAVIFLAFGSLAALFVLKDDVRGLYRRCVGDRRGQGEGEHRGERSRTWLRSRRNATGQWGEEDEDGWGGV